MTGPCTEMGKPGRRGLDLQGESGVLVYSSLACRSSRCFLCFPCSPNIATRVKLWYWLNVQMQVSNRHLDIQVWSYEKSGLDILLMKSGFVKLRTGLYNCASESSRHLPQSSRTTLGDQDSKNNFTGNWGWVDREGWILYSDTHI